MIDELPLDDYGYSIVRARGFDDLLQKPDAERAAVTWDRFIALGEESGRILLQASGGAGKSTSLLRLAKHLHESGRTVHALNLLGVPAQMDDNAAPSLGVDRLLSLATPAISLDDLRDQASAWVFADGVNEVGSMAAPVLRALDELAAALPNVVVIATDRLTRRDVAVTPDDEGQAGHWILATLTEVPDAEIRRVLGTTHAPEGTLAALRNPYFLSIWSDDADSPAELVRTWLTTSGGVPNTMLDRLAEFTLGQYRDTRSRRLDVALLRKAVGPEVVDSMRSSGSLRGSDEEGYTFRHQLVSDYLAARRVSADPDHWDEEHFDALTLRASSFDPLGLLLDLVQESSSDEPSGDRYALPDRLAREVYDWNYYGAVFLVARDLERYGSLSKRTSLPILFMVSSRRFDAFASTASRSRDAIGALGSRDARPFLRPASLEDLVEEASQRSSDVPELWLDLFRRQVEPQEAAPADLASLRSDNSLIGWAASNAVKASRLDEDLDEALSDVLLSDDRPVVRWRAAHALGGASTTQRSMSALLEALDTAGDETRWVRYGALRSLIERSLREESSRRHVWEELAMRANLILHDTLLRRDVRQAVRVDNQPAGWADCVSLLLDELWAREDSAQEQEVWQALADGLYREEADSVVQYAR